jgi:hypothetical protein
MAHECLGYEDSIAEATAIERERIVKILETTGAEFLTRPELDELLGLVRGENR